MSNYKNVNLQVQDHRNLIDWNIVNNVSNRNSSNFTMPIDMIFNDGHKLSIIVLSILMVVSSVGNITVLKLLINRRIKSPSRIDMMLMHLAIADLLVTFLTMPLEIGWSATVSWDAGDFMCRLMLFFRAFGLNLSSFVIVSISVDRYFAVKKPMSLAGIDRRGRVMVFLAWLTSLLCSAPQSYIFHLESHPNITEFTQCVTFHSFSSAQMEVLYAIFGLSMMYAIPLGIIIFCYASIYVELYRKSRKCLTNRFRRSNDDVLSRAKKKTLWMTITIVIVFVICWTPYSVMLAWYWFDKEGAMKVEQRVQKCLFLFACTNSCMNPIVYGLFNIPRRSSQNQLRSISKKVEIIERRRSSINSSSNRSTNSIRRIICVKCGESIEQPNLKNHNLYH